MGCDLRKYSPRTFCICTLRCKYIHNGGIDGRKEAPTAPHLLTSTVPHLVTSMASHVLTSTPPYFSNLLLVISLPRLLVAQTSAASSLAINSVLPKPNTSLSMVVPSSTITATNEAKKAIDNNTWRRKEDTTCTSCCEACEHFTP